MCWRYWVFRRAKLTDMTLLASKLQQIGLLHGLSFWLASVLAKKRVSGKITARW